jgi:hypothetical protein
VRALILTGVYEMKDFEMTQAQLDDLLSAGALITVDKSHAWLEWHVQERINAAWEGLGISMGFDCKTARPTIGKGDRFFTAEETDFSEPQSYPISKGTVFSTSIRAPATLDKAGFEALEFLKLNGTTT